jgi:hypothetical protein
MTRKPSERKKPKDSTAWWTDTRSLKKEHAYGKRNPFETYFEHAGGRDRIVSIVNRYAVIHPRESALEIGPGNVAALEHIPPEWIPQRTFADFSPGILEALKKRGVRGRMVVADVNKPLPLDPHGIVVMSEVLTHIKPENRAEVAARVARLAKHELVITDRKLVPGEGQRTHVDLDELVRALEKDFALRAAEDTVPTKNGETVFFILHGTRREAGK